MIKGFTKSAKNHLISRSYISILCIVLCRVIRSVKSLHRMRAEQILELSVDNICK